MKNKSEKIYLALSVVFLIILGFSFFILNKKTRNNLEIAKQSESNLGQEISKRNEIKNLNNYFNSIKNEKALFETHFVQSSDVVSFLNTLESLAKNAGTTGEVIDINLSDDKKSLLVEMKDTGTFPNIYKFITLLENAPYEIEFSSINIQNISEESNKTTAKWEAIIKFRLITFI